MDEVREEGGWASFGSEEGKARWNGGSGRISVWLLNTSPTSSVFYLINIEVRQVREHLATVERLPGFDRLASNAIHCLLPKWSSCYYLNSDLDFQQCL